MQGTQAIIDAILINNPLAVSAQLTALGLVQDGEILSPDEIKEVLYDAANRLSDEEGNELAVKVLDVPIDVEGEGAQELLQYHVAHGNRLAIISELESCINSKPGIKRASFQRGMYYSNPIGWLIGVFMVVLIIVLIKKI
jgi:hypothetical protein